MGIKNTTERTKVKTKNNAEDSLDEDKSSQTKTASSSNSTDLTPVSNTLKESTDGASSGKEKTYRSLKAQGYTRIVGGEVADKNAAPWQVAMVDANAITMVMCGGTVICKNFVVTAWHCFREDVDDGKVKAKGEQDFNLIVGVNDISLSKGPTSLEPGASFHTIKKIHRHPKTMERAKRIPQDGTTWHYDIALLELNEPIEFRKEAKPLALPAPGDMEKWNEETHFTVSGWGNTMNKTTGDLEGDDELQRYFPSKLMMTSVDYVGDKYCSLNVKQKEDKFCAGIMEGGRDSCLGDSGGPLVWLDKKHGLPKLVGVVSFGKDCAQPVPNSGGGVYANVEDVRDWIKETTNGCNDQTCNVEKKCMTIDNLHPQLVESLERRRRWMRVQ